MGSESIARGWERLARVWKTTCDVSELNKGWVRVYPQRGTGKHGQFSLAACIPSRGRVVVGAAWASARVSCNESRGPVEKQVEKWFGCGRHCVARARPASSAATCPSNNIFLEIADQPAQSMDITRDFNGCLQSRDAKPVAKHDFDIQRLNTFLQEAYSINARIADLTRELRSIRPAYLSTAPPSRKRAVSSTQDAHHDRAHPLTNGEREAIDAQSKQLLRQLNNAVSDLKQAEEVRNQTEESVALSKRAKGGLGAIGRWAAGGAVTAKSPEEELEEAQRKSVATHRESVIAYLQRKLEEAGRVQSEMMEVRLNREIEKTKSILSKSTKPPALSSTATDHNMAGPPSPTSRRARGSIGSSDPPDHLELTQEQQQVFAEENHELLKHYEDQLDQVRTAERSILEISELHATLHANLVQQSEHIEQLAQDSELTTENLGKGNKELKRASERRSTAQAIFYSTAAFCSFLIVWDLIF